MIVVRDKMLRPENGDRLGVVNKLVMVTDGLSDIRPDLVERMAVVSIGNKLNASLTWMDYYIDFAGYFGQKQLL